MLAFFERLVHANRGLEGGGRTMKMHRYATIDAPYFDEAPVRFDVRTSLDYPREVVFKIFEDNRAWEAFEFGITKATWTSPPPLGPGTTRRVELSRWIGGGIVDEVFFEWKPEEHFAFYMHEGTSASIHAYGERWSVTGLAGDRTELRCRTAFALKSGISNRLVRLLSPIVRLGFVRVLTSVRRYLDEQRAD
jgi:hypothetical protein